MNLFNTFAPYLSSIITPDWTVHKDIPYGVTNDEKADLYLLNKGVHPVVVFIHGGGWSSGDKSAYAGRAKKYALAGYHVIAINYRLAEMDVLSTHWPAQLQDCQLAIRWIRQNAATFRIDLRRIGVGGDSAGGHLALMLGACPTTVKGDRSHLYPLVTPRVSGILNMFGPCDLTQPQMKALIEPLPLFAGHSYDPLEYKDASPVFKITPSFPPTCIIHGTQDETVHFEQSLILYEALERNGVQREFHPFEGGHEIGKLSSWEQIKLEMKGIKFFSKVLHG